MFFHAESHINCIILYMLKIKYDTSNITSSESLAGNKYEDKRKDVPDNKKLNKRQPVLNQKSEEKMPISRQYKTGSRFPDIHSQNTRTGSRIHSPQHKSSKPVRLPGIDHRPGISHLKVNTCLHVTSSNT